MWARPVTRCFSSAPASCLAKDRYTYVKKGNFGRLSNRHVQEFEQILGRSGVLTDQDDVFPYNRDILRAGYGSSTVVLRPNSVEEVSEIMKICDRDTLAVCPQGGNTSFAGGSTPIFDEVIISLSRMNRIIEIDKLAGNVTCEAGCIVQQINNELEPHDLILPHDLGSKGSCQIGGNISTCAGGLRLLRYGNFQGNTLGLEVVLANGSVLNCLNKLKKDNTGYHLRQLFIGAEGTLGIVTKAVIQCPPKPKSVNFAFLGLNSFTDVLSTYYLAKRMLSETLSACEMIDSPSMHLASEKLGLKCPLSPHNFYMVVETHGSNEKHDQEKMTLFLDKAFGDKIVQDGTFTNEPSKMRALWQLRERLGESLIKGSVLYEYDISLPLDETFYDIVNIMREKLKGTNVSEVTGYSHIGDGNLHLNILSKDYDQCVVDILEEFMYDWIKKKGGSISSEHGIGVKKTPHLKYSKSPEAINLMQNIKKTLDPKGILNPYKVLPL